jgi:hypothetical protein
VKASNSGFGFWPINGRITYIVERKKVPGGQMNNPDEVAILNILTLFIALGTIASAIATLVYARVTRDSFRAANKIYIGVIGIAGFAKMHSKQCVS